MTRSDLISRRSLLTASLALLATPAFARSAKKEEKGKEGGGTPPDPIVKLQPIAIPIIVNGRLLNYIFVNLSLKLAATVPVTVMAGQEPLLRDAIVKAAHRTPFTAPDSYVEVDAARLKAVVMREAVTLLGKGKVASVEITKQIARNQISHPSGPKRPNAQAPAAAEHH